jgi:biotin carboxylase
VTRTLLIVSGGAEAVPGIRLAKRMGLHVVVSDGSADAPGLAEADDALIASTYDVEATIGAAVEYSRTVRRLDGVMCIASDVPVTVASVAAAFGLPGIPLEAARLAADKIAMKERFVEQGIPVPWFAAVASADALREIVAERGLPLVIKPVDSRGARGVLRLIEGVDPDWAFGHARSWSPTGRVMIEEYVPGPQLSTESLLLYGVGHTPGFCDRNYEFLDRFAPWIIENGGEQPSVLSATDQQAVADLAERAGAAIGISTGIVKGDMVLTPSGPKVIEVAARLSGGWFSTDQIPLATGVDLVGAAIRVAVGDAVSREDLTPAYHGGVAIRYFFPRPGRVTAISGADRFQRVPWVHRLGFTVGVGDIVKAPTDHTLRAGLVITSGDTRDEAVERAREVASTVRIATVMV